jgi:hypothetical protein
MGLREVTIKVLAQQTCMLENPEVGILVDEFKGLAVGVLKLVGRALVCWHSGPSHHG